MQEDKGIYFSVIVPVYNVELYLEKCIESILCQTYKYYEIILVDDGSTDKSSDICDKYCQKYPFILVIHKKNGGLSAARNVGLDFTSGKYVLFVDSDDYIEPSALQRFYEETVETNVDVVAAYNYKFSTEYGIEDGYPFRKNVNNILSGKDYFTKTLHQCKYSAAAPYKLTKLSVIKDNNLRFKEELLHEDELWTPILLLNCKSVIDIKYRFYCYRCDNIESITRNPDKARRRAIDRVAVSKLLASIYDGDGKYRIKAFGDNIAAQYMYAVYIGNLLEDTHFSVERFYPLKYAKTIKYIGKAILFFLSPTLACFIRKIK